MRGLIILVLILFSCNQVFAFEKIEGAFGLKLGDIFDPTKAISKVKASDYLIAPPQKNKMFARYYVSITPKTHFIRSIAATTPVLKSCEQEAAALIQTLSEKYGPIKSIKGSFFITQETRNIGVHCQITPHNNLPILFLSYFDSTLEQLSKKEIEPPVGIDKSGL